MNIEVIQDDMQLLSRIQGNHLVEESQKVAPPSALRMPTSHLPGQHLQGGKQCGGPMAFVLMAEARHRLAIGQLQVPEKAKPRCQPVVLYFCVGQCWTGESFR